MERRGHCHGMRPPPLQPPPRRARGERRQSSAGSFSASLLDAIYRSLDDQGDGADAVVDAPRWSEERAAAPPQFWWAKEGAKLGQAEGCEERDRRRWETGVAARPRHSGYASSTASSSDPSSAAGYSSFSCSSASTTDTESAAAARRRHSPPPPRPSEEEVIAAADDDEEAAAAPRNSKGKKKKARPCFPAARLRPRSSPQSSPPPAGRLPPPSPASFACVLKALFSSARLQRKPKAPAGATPAPVSPPPPQPSRTSETCTVKAGGSPEEPERRTARFCPDAEASVVRRRVEELVRSLEELEEDDEGSDCSSDLFELDSLRGAGGANELPVYGTTSIAANRAIAQGTVC